MPSRRRSRCHRTPASAVLGVLAVLAAVAACGGPDDDAADPSPSAASSAASSESSPSTPATSSGSSASTAPPATTSPSSPSTAPAPSLDLSRHVVVVSVDGLNPEALRLLGPDRAPAISRLLADGAGTLDARTEVELTDTLPNHVGMVTGRPVDPASGGHGVTWNDDLPGRTVEAAAGEPVESIFSVIARGGGTSEVFAGKTKFNLFEASWPDDVDVRIEDDQEALGVAAVEALTTDRPDLTFVHLAQPDVVGHVKGWLSPAYLRAMRRTDRVVGRLVRAVSETPELRETTYLVLSSDHGGTGHSHRDPARRTDYTIPFVVAGPGIPSGDLYDLSPGLLDPEGGRPLYDGPQPVRNCDVANVVARLLALARCPAAGAPAPCSCRCPAAEPPDA